LVAAVVLYWTGSVGGAVEQALVVFVSAVVAVVAVPSVQFVWNWTQAPMRLLTDDVVAIRARLDEQRPEATGRLSPETEMQVRQAATLIQGELENTAATLRRVLDQGAFTGKDRIVIRTWQTANPTLAGMGGAEEAHKASREAYRRIRAFPDYLPDSARLPLSDAQRQDVEAAVAAISTADTELLLVIGRLRPTQ